MLVLRVFDSPTALTGSGTTIHQLTFNGHRGASKAKYSGDYYERDHDEKGSSMQGTIRECEIAFF